MVIRVRVLGRVDGRVRGVGVRGAEVGRIGRRGYVGKKGEDKRVGQS